MPVSPSFWQSKEIQKQLVSVFWLCYEKHWAKEISLFHRSHTGSGEGCREETADQQPVVCKPSIGWSIHDFGPFSCHQLGAPGCRCWLDPLCPWWGALRQDLMGPLPLRTEHCTGMDLGCLWISFLKIVLFSFVRMTTLFQVSTEMFPIKCCLQCHCSVGATTLLGFVLVLVFSIHDLDL